MAKDKLQKGIEGTTFKPQKKLLGVFGESKESQKKMYDKTSALKRDAHRKGRVEGKKFRAKSFVDRKTGTLKLDTVSNRKRYGERVYKAPDVSYVEPIKYSKGGLKGNQKKLDKNNNNRIDAEDFKILRGGKTAMKAKKGKLVPLKKDPTKAISSVKPSAGGKGGPPSKTPKEARSAVEDFIKRRKKLAGVGKVGRIGAAAALLGLAGAGAAKLGQTIGRKISEKKNKKMGGGMMKKPMGYTKGGGADTGTMGEAKSKLSTAIDAFERRRKKIKLEAPRRGPMNPAKAMGGGMMMKPMGYKSGTSVKVKCKLGRNKPTKMY